MYSFVAASVIHACTVASAETLDLDLTVRALPITVALGASTSMMLVMRVLVRMVPPALIMVPVTHVSARLDSLARTAKRTLLTAKITRVHRAPLASTLLSDSIASVPSI